MVYRRGKRPSFYFEAKQRVGYKQLCTDTSDRRTAQRIEHAWGSLADQRAWDLLEPIVTDLEKPKKQRTHTVGRLLDLWTETKGDVAAMRLKAADVNVEPFVDEWAAIYETQVEPDTAAHALTHVRAFFPKESIRLASAVTADWIATELAKYQGKRNTRRKVHSSLSVFCDYLVMPKKIFAASPMLHVERPKRQLTPPVFYDAPTVAKIIDHQPNDARRAYFALVYGTGADVSPALIVERADINPAAHEVRIVGTKTAFRDRIVRVSDASWPTFWNYAKTTLSGRIFPSAWNRWTVSDWHRQTVGDGVKDTHGNVEREGLKLSKKLPLRKARHHFAVRLLEAGTPVRVVAEQLGSDERTVLKHYGPWITSADDRAKWEKIATKHETKRRSAK